MAAVLAIHMYVGLLKHGLSMGACSTSLHLQSVGPVCSTVIFIHLSLSSEMNDCGQATVNPIMRIPIEVLGIIMRWTLAFPLESVTNWRRDHNSWTYSRTLMLLSQICCSWRYAVVADAELWAILPCELPESLFALHLERSGGQAITLYFAYSYLGLSTSADGPERLVFNLLSAIGTGNPIQELSALLTPERLDYLLEQSH
jgi:hypothetical protein